MGFGIPPDRTSLWGISQSETACDCRPSQPGTFQGLSRNSLLPLHTKEPVSRKQRRDTTWRLLRRRPLDTALTAAKCVYKERAVRGLIWNFTPTIIIIIIFNSPLTALFLHSSLTKAKWPKQPGWPKQPSSGNMTTFDDLSLHSRFLVKHAV